MNRIIFLLTYIIFFSLGNTCNSQSKPDIQYISLQDTFLVHVLDSLIQHEEKKDSLFSKGLGYFNIEFRNKKKGFWIPSDNNEIDTVFQYDIQITHMHPDGEINTLGDMYPTYYSIVRDRVVTIGGFSDAHYFDFSEGSKKVYLEILKKNLAPEGHASLSYFRLGELTHIFYLKNRFNGKYEKPVVRSFKNKVPNNH